MKKSFKQPSGTLPFLLVWLGLSLVALGVTKIWVQGADLGTSASLGNSSPVFSGAPSDNGSDSTDPTNEGDNVTFTATGRDDANNDDYYFIVCKTDAVLAQNDRAPRCGTSGSYDDMWGVSNVTSSGSGASTTYTVSGDESCDESCAWYAYVCDKLPTDAGPLCFPASGSGDQGLAVGFIAFTGVPDDQATVTIDSTIYEFDTTDGATCSGGEDVCVDVSGGITNVGDVSSALAGDDDGGTIGSHMEARYDRVYVYADAAGAGGNSIGMSESGDTGNDITLSGSTLSGGSASNMSPFKVNHPPAISSVTITDTGDSTIEPGENLKFTATIADGDTDGSQDTVSMYVCTPETTEYYSGCTDGSLVCSTTGQTPGSGITCSETGNTLVPDPTPGGSHDVKIFVFDSHSLQSDSVVSYSYTVTNSDPVVTNYTLPSTPSIAAGDFEVVEFKATIQDSNMDTDIVEVEGVLFDDDSTNNTCDADEKDCYIDDSCKLTEVSGQDNQMIAICQVRVYFNANASSSWKAHVNVMDKTQGYSALGDSSGSLTISSLQGLEVENVTSIDYGTFDVSETSIMGVTIPIANLGNQVIDVLIDGTDMSCSTGATCGSYSISRSQQKWHHSSSTFVWDDPEPVSSTWEGPWVLESSATTGATTNGCANRDIPIRTSHTSTSNNESIYFKFRAPVTQSRGTYTGTVSFTATSSSDCTDTPGF